jgi:hypothetical protein
MAILPPALKYFYNFPDVVSMMIDGDDAIIRPVVAWHKEKLNPDAQKFLRLRALQSSIAAACAQEAGNKGPYAARGLVEAVCRARNIKKWL